MRSKKIQRRDFQTVEKDINDDFTTYELDHVSLVKCRKPTTGGWITRGNALIIRHVFHQNSLALSMLLFWSAFAVLLLRQFFLFCFAKSHAIEATKIVVTKH